MSPTDVTFPLNKKLVFFSVTCMIPCSNRPQSRVYRGEMLYHVAHSQAAYGSYLFLVQVQFEVRASRRVAAKYQFNPNATSTLDDPGKQTGHVILLV